MYAETINGIYQCHEDTSQTLTAGTSYPVSLPALASPNQYEWQIIFNGTVENLPVESFNTAAGVTNGERHDVELLDLSVEPATSDFTTMKYWQANPPPGGSPGWVNWATRQCYYGPPYANGKAYLDPAYSNQFPGSTEVTVTTSASQCPV